MAIVQESVTTDGWWCCWRRKDNWLMDMHLQHLQVTAFSKSIGEWQGTVCMGPLSFMGFAHEYWPCSRSNFWSNFCRRFWRKSWRKFSLYVSLQFHNKWHLSSSQHIWCINKTRIAYNLEIEDLKPFLQFWIKHCDETKDNHTDGCTCVAKMKNRVVTYLNTLMINKHFSKSESNDKALE